MSKTTRESSRFETEEPLNASAEDMGHEAMSAREAHVRASFWKKLAKFAGRIPFAEDLVAAYYCALDPDTPLKVRGTLFGALAYFILPIDGIPDFILGLGFTDDAAVIATAISMVARHIKPVHREAAARALEKGIPDADKADTEFAETIDLEANETRSAS